MIDLSSRSSRLILNPRLPAEQLRRFEQAWEEHVEGKIESHVGIVTSGSSGGMGKLILLSFDAMTTSARAVNERFSADASDVWMKTLPDFHVGGLGIQIRALLNGAKVVESQISIAKWDALKFSQELEDSKATLVSLVPTQLFDLVMLDCCAPSSLRVAFIGGGRLESVLKDRATQLGWPVLTSYGMTECSSTVAVAVSVEDSRLLPLSHVKIRTGASGFVEISSASLLTAQIVFDADGGTRVVDPTENQVVTNLGASFFRDAVMSGNNSNRNEATSSESSRWFTTEDQGEIDSVGSLTIRGRSQDFVKIGGEGVVVSRLEETLESLKLKLGFKGDAAVLAAPDDRLGAAIVLISTAGELETQRLREAFNAHVAPFERARRIYVVDAIPRSPLGKLLRAEALALVGLKPLINF